MAHSEGVEVFDGISWTYYGDKYGTEPKIEVASLFQASALVEDNRGYIWAGTSYKGISVFNGSDWTNYDIGECLLGGSVNSIASDSLGRIWVGTDFGLAVFDGNNWFHYTKHSSGLVSNEVDDIIVTGAGPSLPPTPALGIGSAKGKLTRNGQPLAGATVVVCLAPYFFWRDTILWGFI